MAFEKEFAKLNLERKRSVNQIARSWGDNKLLRSPESSRAENERQGVTGSRLIARLQISAKELYGRVVGRNKDDASYICKCLEVLEKEWELLEHSLKRSEQELQARSERSADSDRSRALSSPNSADSHYIAKQHERIQQLEDQDKQLRDELRQLKNESQKQHVQAKQGTIIQRLMEHQAAIHRQEIQQREEAMAQREAELERLRRQLPNPHPPTHPQKERQPQGQAARPAEQYVMAGRLAIGQRLQILGPCDENAPNAFQWYRITGPGNWQEISGAKRNQYSPEPYDVGVLLGCCITPPQSSSSNDVIRVSSMQPVVATSGFEDALQELVAEGGAKFRVRVVQKNGMLHTNRQYCTLEVSQSHMTLRLPNDITLQQLYHSGMQICGARGAGDGAMQGVFLALKHQEAYMLVCDSAYERNICIQLARKMAAQNGFALKGPTEAMSPCQ